MRWLLTAGPPEMIGEEIDLLAASLLPANEHGVVRTKQVPLTREARFKRLMKLLAR